MINYGKNNINFIVKSWRFGILEPFSKVKFFYNDNKNLKLSKYLEMHGKFYEDSVTRKIKSPFS